MVADDALQQEIWLYFTFMTHLYVINRIILVNFWKAVQSWEKDSMSKLFENFDSIETAINSSLSGKFQWLKSDFLKFLIEF